MPDRTEFSYDANRSLNSAGAVTTEIDNNTSLTHHWESNKIRTLQVTVTSLQPKIANRDVEFMIGGLYRHKNRDAEYITYSLTGGKSTLYNNNFSNIPFRV